MEQLNQIFVCTSHPGHVCVYFSRGPIYLLDCRLHVRQLHALLGSEDNLLSYLCKSSRFPIVLSPESSKPQERAALRMELAGLLTAKVTCSNFALAWEKYPADNPCIQSSLCTGGASTLGTSDSSQFTSSDSSTLGIRIPSFSLRTQFKSAWLTPVLCPTTFPSARNVADHGIICLTPLATSDLRWPAVTMLGSLVPNP